MFDKRIKTHHMGNELKYFMESPGLLIDALDTNGKKDQVIYIHIPYCSNICSFCNMNRTMNTPAKNYVDLILQQLDFYAQTKKFRTSTFSAIYFGGGTPTVLSAQDLSRILDQIQQKANLEPDVEITVETSLTDLTKEKLQLLKEKGVNRLSIGVQTFSDKGRQLLHRRGNGDYAFRKLQQFRNMDFPNINMDLIYHYPEETREDLLEDLRKIDLLDLAGFSFYSLIIMPSSSLGYTLTTSHFSQTLEKDKMFFDTIIANTHSYNYLELTKLVKKNRDHYKYITLQLEGHDIYPLGAGAGGSIGHAMLMNPIDLTKYQQYVDEIHTAKVMRLSPRYFQIKRAIDSLQQLIYDPSRFPFESSEPIEKFFTSLVKNHYLKKHHQTYHLTDQGVFWGNNIIQKLWDIVIDTYIIKERKN